MLKLTMMRGLPGAGKSTRAQELATERGNTVRVNKDLLRQMLHFNVWRPQNEAGIWDVERMVAEHYLSFERQNVIVDDTNLTDGHEQKWRDFVDSLQRKGLTELEFEIHDMKTDVFTCIERDAAREHSVGSDVIMQYAMANGMIDENVHYVISDLDGTLADLTHRRHYVREKPKNWKAFFEEMHKDTLREDVLADVEATLAQAREDGKRTYFVIVSARPEIYKEQTKAWLEKMGIDDYCTLIMRRAGDSRDDTIVKREILHKYFKDKSKIIKVFDDRPRVIRMWREEGLDVVDVGDGEEF